MKRREQRLILGRAGLTLCLLPGAFATAQEAEEGPAVEELVVVGVRDTHTIRTNDIMVSPADTAQLLKKMPGANINKNGELTGIAQYRGMHGNRVNVSVNGAHISGAGPNAMDTPLHYAPVAILDSLTITRGIAPVSAGLETIGGNMEAITYKGEFAGSSDLSFSGRSYLGAQSVNKGTVASGFFSLSSRNHLIRTFLMQEEGDDAEFDDGVIRPSEYERGRFDLGYGYRRDDHEFQIDVSRNNTGPSGTPALPMDIRSVDSDLLNSSYEWQGSDFRVSAELFASDKNHTMTNYELRRPPQTVAMTDDPMRFRQAVAESGDAGFSLQIEQETDNGLWRYGMDGQQAEHDTDIINPNVSGFNIVAFNGAEKNLLGAFVEREMSLGESLGTDLGIRYVRASMDAGQVSANLNPMSMPSGMPVMMNNMAAALAGDFNSQDLSQHDNSVDWFARLNFNTGGDMTWYAGAARKSRSPSYQERYIWLPAETTGGLADGRTYIGDASLDPEVAHELEFGFDLERGDYGVLPRLFYKEVADYIQGVAATNEMARSFSSMMGMGLNPDGLLQYSNVDARLYGMDLEGYLVLSERLRLRAVASMVRGEREDIDDNLYRISPDNLVLALDYRATNWSASLETVSYASQDRISETNGELPTAGYSLVNLSGRLYYSRDLEVGLGVNNLFDRGHREHLSGYNRAFNPDVPMGERMPGQGRNLYARLMWHF